MIPLVAPFLVLVAAHFLFRYAYYGEWLPNTYYAKHVRPWYESGFRYLTAAALETGLYILLPLALLALRTRWRMASRWHVRAGAALCRRHMAYLLPIGGDHFEYRPLDFYWPLLASPRPKASLFSAPGFQPAWKVPKSRAAGGRRTCTIALFLPVLFYANSIQAVLLFEGARNTRATTSLCISNSIRERRLAAGRARNASARRHLQRYAPAVIQDIWSVHLRFAEHRDSPTGSCSWKPYEEWSVDLSSPMTP